MNSKKRRAIAVIVSLCVIALAATGWWYFAASAPKEQAAAVELPTVKVVKQDLTDQQKLAGKVSFGAASSFKGTKAGTITWLPDVGSVVNQGEALYKVNDQPIIVFIGNTPLYRPIDQAGLQGPDVKVIKDNLRALGFLGNDGKADTTTAATMTAIKQWQKANKLDPSGKLVEGDAVVKTSGLRVSTLKSALGDPGAAEIMTTTALVPQVTVALADSASPLVKDAVVQISTPDGAKHQGKVLVDTQPVATAAGAEQAPGAGPSASKQAVVGFDSAEGLNLIEGASVSVETTTVDLKSVLTVPVVSLNALLEGGYALRIPQRNSEGKTEYSLIPVKVGTIVKGTAEVSGNIQEGTEVVSSS